MNDGTTKQAQRRQGALLARAAATLLAFVCVLGSAGALASGTKTSLDRAIQAYHAGQYERAESELRALVERQPYSAQALEYLGRTLLALEQWAEAVERLIQSYELLPEHRKRAFWASLWREVVAAVTGLLESGRGDEAVRALAEVWRLDAVSPDSREQLARAFTEHAVRLLTEGRFEEALSAFAQSEGIRTGEVHSL